MSKPVSFCSELGCGRRCHGQGLCRLHYDRLYIHLPEVNKKRRERARDWKQRLYEDEVKLQARREIQRKRYAEDLEYRDRCRKRAAQYRMDPKTREKALLRKRVTDKGFSPSLVLDCRAFQKGKCDICTRDMVLGRKGAHTECADHDHELRTPRGLLCSTCNQALGHYEKHQKPAGLVIAPYEEYLADPPVKRLQSAVSNPAPSRSSPSTPEASADSIQ